MNIDLNKFNEAKDKLRKEIWKYPNVVGISNTPKKKIVKGVEVDVPCIRVYVKKKVPKNQLKPSEVIPEEVNGVKTDVVEVGEFKALSVPLSDFRRRHRPVICGVSTSRADEVARGTIGWFVIDEDFNLYLISNNHVWAKENEGKVGDDLVQPGLYDGGDPAKDIFANLHDFIELIPKDSGVNYVDLAVAKPIDVKVSSPQILSSFGVSGLSPIYVNSSVKKIGATTGLTCGKIIDDSVTVEVQYRKFVAKFEDVVMIEGTNFVQAGDSGSPVLESDGKFVGLIFAGNESGNYGLACKHNHITNQLSTKWSKKVNILIVYTYEPYRYIEVVKRLPYPPSELLPYILLVLLRYLI
mgnify:CR=1 FL=1